MRKIEAMKLSIVSTLLLVISISAHPWSRYETYKNTYLGQSENQTQSKLDEMQRRLDQAEFDRQLERDEQNELAEQAAILAKEEADERAEEAKIEAENIRQEAEDRANEIANASRISAAGNRNNLYAISIFLFFAISLYKIKKDKRNNLENSLRPQEKTGVVITISAFLILISALFVSSPWVPQLDIWQNLMLDFLTIDILPNVQTKFIVLPCIVLIMYGILVYLEIIKAPKFLLKKFEE